MRYWLLSNQWDEFLAILLSDLLFLPYFWCTDLFRMVLFQGRYPMLAKSEVKISLNENATQPCTVFIDNLFFHISFWQLVLVNISMTNCHAVLLRLELKLSTLATLQNSVFKYWIFEQVQQVIIKNCTNSIDTISVDSSDNTLQFINSSGSVENLTIRTLNFTNFSGGLIIQINSYIQITKSEFLNNSVNFGIIKILNSSTLEMLDYSTKQ